MDKYDIYLASPLFSITDNSILDSIENRLDELGLIYFSPRHQSNFDMSKAKNKKEKDKIAKDILESNLRAIDNSKIILANTKGIRWDNAIYTDQGTSFEIGYAVGTNKPFITFNMEDYGLNIMLSQTVVTHISGLNSNIRKLDKVKDINDFINIHSYSIENIREKFYNHIEEQV